MKKYQCGRCNYSCDDLEQFGGHPCVGTNRVLAALALVISMPDFVIDMRPAVVEGIAQQRLRMALDGLEDALRRGQL